MKKFRHIGNNNQLCVNNLNADSLNTYFVNVGENLSSVLPVHVKPKSKNKCSSPLFLKKTCPHEIARCISSLKNSRSEDLLGISKKLSKLANFEINGVLFFLINRAISERKLRNVFKIANVIPLFKSGSKLDCSNYRPISLLPVIRKIFERILKTRIVFFSRKI